MTMGVCGYIESDGVKYWKPNMAALEGEWGREIIEEIKNASPPDFAKIDAEVAEIEARMREAKANGTF